MQVERALVQETLLLSMFMKLGKVSLVGLTLGLTYPLRHMVPYDQPEAAFVSRPF